MSSIVVRARRRVAIGRRSRASSVAAAATVSATAFVLVRLNAALPQPGFEGACARLRASGLELTARDWFCRPSPWTVRFGYVAGSLLVAIGFAIPPAILAATGRRWTAFLPLLPVLGAPYRGVLYAHPGPWWNEATWPRGELAGGAFTLALLALPAMVLALGPGRPEPRPERVSLGAGLAAALPLAVPAIPSWWLVNDLFDRHLAVIGGTMGEATALAWSAAAIVLFGALLGHDRRWWPWSVVIVALLVSMAPSTAMTVGPERLLDWSRFGAVVPLVALGLLASAWRPLGAWITRKAELPGEGRYRRDPIGPSPPPTPRRRVRPTAVLNALAVGLVVVSAVAYRADPLPIQIGAAVPTYLGERNAAEDVRTRMNLQMGIRAMDRYHAENGTYRGFDAATGSTIQPALEWIDGPPKVSDARLRVSIVAARGDVARLVSLSGSARAFCIQRDPSGLTYGSAGPGNSTGRPTPDQFERAIAACGSTTWSPSAVRPPPWRNMCDGVDESAYLICRMVQAMQAQVLAGPRP